MAIVVLIVIIIIVVVMRIVMVVVVGGRSGCDYTVSLSGQQEAVERGMCGRYDNIVLKRSRWCSRGQVRSGQGSRSSIHKNDVTRMNISDGWQGVSTKENLPLWSNM